MVFNGKQGKESLICVEVGYKNLSLEITVCLRSASLMKANGDHRNVFFNPTLTLIIYNPYILPGGCGDGGQTVCKEDPCKVATHPCLVVRCLAPPCPELTCM